MVIDSDNVVLRLPKRIISLIERNFCDLLARMAYQLEADTTEQQSNMQSNLAFTVSFSRMDNDGPTTSSPRYVSYSSRSTNTQLPGSSDSWGYKQKTSTSLYCSVTQYISEGFVLESDTEHPNFREDIKSSRL